MILLACTCGKVRIEAIGKPIMVTECHCNSCREAAAHFSTLEGVPDFLSANGGTPFLMMRKDRVNISGSEHLKAFRLTHESTTRRVVASCCDTPAFLEFKGGHWLSIYKSVVPQGAMPQIELRTMTGDLDDPGVLGNSVPTGKRQSMKFFAKLLGAWIAMGFRSPRIEVEQEAVLR